MPCPRYSLVRTTSLLTIPYSSNPIFALLLAAHLSTHYLPTYIAVRVLSVITLPSDCPTLLKGREEKEKRLLCL